jgi:hypothetical protein
MDKERNINMLITARSFNVLFAFGKEMSGHPFLMNVSAAPTVFGWQKFSSRSSSLVGGLRVKSTGTVCSSDTWVSGHHGVISQKTTV